MHSKAVRKYFPRLNNLYNFLNYGEISNSVYTTLKKHAHTHILKFLFYVFILAFLDIMQDYFAFIAAIVTINNLLLKSRREHEKNQLFRIKKDRIRLGSKRTT